MDAIIKEIEQIALVINNIEYKAYKVLLTNSGTITIISKDNDFSDIPNYIEKLISENETLSDYYNFINNHYFINPFIQKGEGNPGGPPSPISV